MYTGRGLIKTVLEIIETVHFDSPLEVITVHFH